MIYFEVGPKMKVVAKEVNNSIQLESLNLDVPRRRYEFLKGDEFLANLWSKIIATLRYFLYQLK